jgi:aryl-alcohol dehydrogenase-like predicted oxidoreductase
MQQRKLGKSGILVSPLAMGCWAYGGGAYWGEQSQQDVDMVVQAALDRGINFFDTAEMYNNGESEISLGKALGNRRKEAVICSKISPSNTAKVREHLIASLRRLGTDYLDIYMLHWPINRLSLQHFTQDEETLLHPPAVTEVYQQLEELKKEGLIRCIGMSNFGVKQMAEVVSVGVPVDVNEMPYNIVSRAIECEIVPFCIKNDIALVASMGLQQGLLTGIYHTPGEVPPNQAHSRHFSQSRGKGASRHEEEGAEDELFRVVAFLKELSIKTGYSPAALAVAWILNKPFIAAALVGSRNLSELAANSIAAGIRLDKAVMDSIDEKSLPVLNKLGASPDYYEDRKKSRIF